MSLGRRKKPVRSDVWVPILGRATAMFRQEISDQIARRANLLDIYYLYCVTTVRNSDCYIGISRQTPLQKQGGLAQKLHRIPDFRGAYRFIIVQWGLTESAAKDAERGLIQICRAGGLKRPINITDGGEIGGKPLGEVIAERMIPLIWDGLQQNVLGQRWIAMILGQEKPALFDKIGRPVSFKSINDPTCISVIEASMDHVCRALERESKAAIQQELRCVRRPQDAWLAELGYPAPTPSYIGRLK